MHGNTKHGMFGTPTYTTWGQMIQRCTNPKSKEYPRYGARGIKVCERWRKFENFLADMGLKPAGLSLERVNNDGDYEPDNCKWATPLEQSRNRSNVIQFTHKGKTQNLTDWARESGIPKSTLHRWYKQGRDLSAVL